MYDLKDERGVPISAGIPPIVVVAVLVGIVLIFAIGTLVFSNARYGHAWPASTATTIPLTS